MSEVKKLGDIASYINGYPFKPEDRGTEGLPIIRIQNMTSVLTQCYIHKQFCGKAPWFG